MLDKQLAAPDPRPMFTLMRRFIKTGIAFLFIGLALGAWLLVRRGQSSSGSAR